MSFLPHAGSSSTGWAAAFGGSVVLHASLAAAALTTATSILPEAETSTASESTYEVSLQILDADLPALSEPEEITPDLPDLNAEELQQLAPLPELPGIDVSALAPEIEAALAPEVEAELPEPAPLDTIETETGPTEIPISDQPDIPDSPLNAEAVADETLSVPDIEQPDPVEAEQFGALSPDMVAIIPDDMAEPSIDPATQPETSVPEQAPVGQDAEAPQALEPSPIQPSNPGATTPQPDMEDALVIEEVEPDTELETSPLGGAFLPTAIPSGPVESTEPSGALADQPDSGVMPSLPPIGQDDLETPEPDLPTGGPVALPSTLDPGDEVQVAALPAPGPEGPLAPTIPNAVPPALGAETGDTPDLLANPIASPTPNQIAVAAMLRRIREVSPPACAIALPRRTGNSQVGVSLIGSRSTAMNGYAAELESGLSPELASVVEFGVETVDERQCGILEAVRQIGSYPATRLGLSFESTQLASGGTLRGSITGAGGLSVAILLIDDNGVVQDLKRFASVEGNTIELAVPVARAGSTRTTRQIFLVLGSADDSPSLGELDGVLASDLSDRLSAQELGSIFFGLATFDVR